MANQINVTEEGLEKLKNELEYLTTVKRKEVGEALDAARKQGDLSENSEYDEAKDEQAKTEARIAELDEILKHVNIVSVNDADTETVRIGNAVTVFDLEYEEEDTYYIVGTTEVDFMQNKISDISPIGAALIGHKIGDEVDVATPSGDLVRLRITDITK